MSLSDRLRDFFEMFRFKLRFRAPVVDQAGSLAGFGRRKADGALLQLLCLDAGQAGRRRANGRRGRKKLWSGIDAWPQPIPCWLLQKDRTLDPFQNKV